VPDGALHLLPFSLLREDAGARPLVERFEIQIVPSASVWLHWRESPQKAVGPGSGALVLANPLLSAGDAPASARLASLAAVPTLGPLPFAEREGKHVLRNLGGYGRLEKRERASEGFLKSTDLAPYRVLHFAAHAYLDLHRPNLSGLVLAAGGEHEDGLLRPSEIARLGGLEDKLVVLAACNTASGEVLRGEGVLSIARAFFQAGAESVVASLWRIDDRLATEFFDGFYRRLSTGASVGHALALTQADWSTNGRPASTWAGFVALGNGDFVPFPDGAPRRRTAHWVLLSVLIAVLALAGYLLRPGGRQ
jgi:CHAT domain-containing protein